MNPGTTPEGAAGGGDLVDAVVQRALSEVIGFVRLNAGARLRARESCADLAQSAVRQVLEHRGRLVGGGEEDVRRLLFATALRVIRNRAAYWRAQKRDASRELRVEAAAAGDEAGAGAEALIGCYSRVSTPSMHAVAREEAARIEAAFDQLGDEEREVITLSRIVGLPHAEIAAHLGKSEGATRVFLHRALARLAQHLAGPEDGTASR